MKVNWHVWLVFTVQLVLILIAASVVGFTESEDDETGVRCAALCDPFVVESCGKGARTATCKTTKGYAVRTMDENGEIKTEM